MRKPAKRPTLNRSPVDMVAENQKPGKLVVLFCLVAAMTVATYLRLSFLDLSLWLDELHTSWVVSGSWSEIAPRARIGSSSPVYFWLVGIVIQIFGSSEATLRIVSVLASVLSLPLGYRLARVLGASPIASLAVPVLLAIDWERVHFGTDARPYALVELLTLCQMLLFWRAMSSRTLWIHAGSVAASVLLVSLHYVAGLLLVAEGIFLLCRWKFSLADSSLAKPSWKWLAVDVAVIALGCLPIAANAWQVIADRNSLEYAARYTPPMAIVTIFPVHLYVLLPAAIVLLLTYGTQNQEADAAGSGLRSPILLCLLWTLLPTTIAWIAAWQGMAPVFVWRYLVFAALGPALLSALILALLPAARAQWLSVAIVVLIFGWFNSPASMPSLEKHRDNWRSAIAFLNEKIETPASVVYLRSELFESEAWWNAGELTQQEFCQFPLRGLYQAKGDYVFTLPISTEFELTPRHVAATQAAESVWVVCRSMSGDTAQQAAQTLSRILSQQLSTADVQVTVGEIEPFGAIAVFPLVVQRAKQDLSPQLFGN